MDQEPHHHLALQNDYVKVFNVEVSPGDSIVLHRHDQDTVAIAIGEQLVTVGIPGKPDVHQKNEDAQVRLQRGGYMHSTQVDGDMPYHTVAVELLHPQTNFHNVCAEILAGQPVPCQLPPKVTTNTKTGRCWHRTKPRSCSHESFPINHRPRQSFVKSRAPQVIVALDAVVISSIAPRAGKEIATG